jgi:hypothetical protein
MFADKEKEEICGGSLRPSFVNDPFIFMNDAYLGYASRKGMAPERALFLVQIVLIWPKGVQNCTPTACVLVL